MNLTTPLLRSSFSIWTEAHKADRLDLIDCTTLGYRKNDFDRIKGTLCDFPKQLLASLPSNEPRLTALVSLIRRVSTVAADPASFIQKLAHSIIRARNAGRLERAFAVDILFGKWKKKEEKLDKEWGPTVIFDVAELDAFAYKASDPGSIRAAGGALLRAEQAESNGGEARACALSGELDEPFTDKFPNPSLGLLGPTYLFSMNENAPCQQRYGHFGADIFPVGKNAVLRLNNSVTWIAGVANRGVTWTGLPAAVGKTRRGKQAGAKAKQTPRQDLCIAYIEEEPQAPIMVSAFFAGYAAKPAFASEQYKQRVQGLFKAIYKLPDYSLDLHIRILILHKLDPGRTQIELTARYTVESLQSAYSRWMQGCRNLPLIRIPYPGERKGELRFSEEYILSHADLIKCFRTNWVRAGERSELVSGVRTDRLFHLYFELETKKLSEALLQRLMPAVTPLLIGLSRLLSRDDLKKQDILPVDDRLEAERVLALIGVLLHRQGRFKEDYVNQRDFLIGQFLQMADVLHKKYCQVVRKGDIPPQLVGNAAIPMATQSPSRALSVLGSRLRIYLAWADRLSPDLPKEETNKITAKWARAELRSISTQLEGLGPLDSAVTTNGKAELLLGYLARRKKNDH